MAQFRLSSHNLAIETGRHCRPKKSVENRICEYCTAKLIDDEAHFILKCTYHTVERRKLFESARDVIYNFDRLPDKNKFVKLVSSLEKPVIKALAKFVYTAFMARCTYDNVEDTDTECI